MHSTRRLRTVADAAPIDAGVDRHRSASLHTPEDVVVVPHLAQHSQSIVVGSLASGCGVVAWARAAHIGQGAEAIRQRGLHPVERDGGPVVRLDVCLGQPAIRGKRLIVLDCRLEKVNHLLVFLVLWPVAGQVEGRVAGPVLGELVSPEIAVRGAL